MTVWSQLKCLMEGLAYYRGIKKKTFIYYFCDTACNVIKEIKSCHVVWLHDSSSASRAFNASSIFPVTVKRETADGTAGSERFYYYYYYYFRAPIFCCFGEISVIWVSGALTIITQLQRAGPSFQWLWCSAAKCHLLTSLIRGFILWTLGCGGIPRTTSSSITSKPRAEAESRREM